VNRSQHPRWTRIQGHPTGWRAPGRATFADDDPVGAMAQGGFQQIFKRDCALMVLRLGFGGDHVGFCGYYRVPRVFDNQDAVFIGNRIRQDVEQASSFPCGVPGPRSGYCSQPLDGGFEMS